VAAGLNCALKNANQVSVAPRLVDLPSTPVSILLPFVVRLRFVGRSACEPFA